MIHLSVYVLLTAFGATCGLIGFRHGFRAGSRFTLQTFKEQLEKEKAKRERV